jgi:acetyl esterase/lipase
MAHFPITEQLSEITFPLWPGPAPLSQGHAPDDRPSLTPFLPENPGQLVPALIIFPGGGYAEHAFDEEGIRLAERFQKKGVATFLLRYRLVTDGYRHPAQLLDAQRSIRMVRHRSGEWKIDSTRITVMGFSAGGHLASLTATHFDAGDPRADDPIDCGSSRPDGVILVYPVISLATASANPGTTINLLGADPDPRLVALLSSERQVTPQTPPTLLVHGEDDATVSIEHSRLMFAALQKAGVPSEFHAYPNGKHGFGCFAHDPQPPGWLDRVEDWLKGQGLMPQVIPG